MMCCCAIWEGTRDALEKFPKCEDCQSAHVDEDGDAIEGCGYRAEAYLIAYRAKQIGKTERYPLLYSEDLW